MKAIILSSDSSGSRFDFIDVLKGIGILLVVAGHIFPPPFRNIIFIFHMPLFFLIGGFLFKPSANFKHFFNKKFRQLIIPYIGFLLILYPVQHIYLESELTLKLVIAPFIGGIALKGWTGVFWFVTCFFITQQLFNILVIRYSEKLLFIVLVSFLISLINSEFFNFFWLPFNTNVSLAALPYFFIGYVLRKKNKLNLTVLIVSIFISIVVILFEFGFFSKSLAQDMKVVNYGIPILSFIGANALVLVCILLSLLISKNNISSLFKFFGVASMFIMFLHQPIQMLIRDQLTDNIWIRFAAGSIVSVVIYLAVKRNAILTKLLIGK